MLVSTMTQFLLGSPEYKYTIVGAAHHGWSGLQHYS